MNIEKIQEASRIFCSPYAIVDDGILASTGWIFAGRMVLSRARHDVRVCIRDGSFERAAESGSAAWQRLDDLL